MPDKPFRGGMLTRPPIDGALMAGLALTHASFEGSTTGLAQKTDGSINDDPPDYHQSGIPWVCTTKPPQDTTHYLAKLYRDHRL
jgi:hypothetical protein